MAVYLLHYASPLPTGHQPRHYCGFARSEQTLPRRIRSHARGTSKARLPEVFRSLGIAFAVARVWDDASQAFERKLKNEGHLARHCPDCQGTKEPD